MKKGIKKYLKDREDAIALLLQKPERSYTSETYHKLRVEIKKLNALFELLNYCFKEFKHKKTYKPFKLIFRQAGKVRELQVEERMLKKYFFSHSITGYKNSLKKLLSKEQTTFFSIINTKFSARLKIKYLKVFQFLKLLNKKKVDRYMNKSGNKIEKLLSKNNLRKQDVHELRKRLKTLNYNRKIQELWKQNKTTQKKDILPELLGKWHDCEVTVNDFTKAIDSGEIKKNEVSQLEKIKTKIAATEEHLFNKINKTINQKNSKN